MPSSDLVKSLTTAMMMLELLAQSEDGLTLQQLSAALDLKPPTAHNLLRTLMTRGFVDRKTRPIRYCLGRAVIDLADQFRNRSLKRRAMRVVSELASHLSNARIVFAEEIGGDVVLSLRMTPERPGLVEQPWHSVMLPYTSASVLAFQAFWPHDKRVAHKLRYPFEEYGVNAWQSEEKLEAFLEEARQKGYAAPPVGQSGLYRVAVPVFSATNELLAALGVAISVDAVQDFATIEQDVVRRLKAAAASLAV